MAGSRSGGPYPVNSTAAPGIFENPWRVAQSVKVSFMQATLSIELAQLPAMERLQLAQDLIASFTSEQEGLVTNDAHRHAAQERMAHYLAHPEEPTVTLSQVRASLVLG